jgi:hypothetical protein
MSPAFPSGGFVDEGLFGFLLDWEIKKARRLRYYLSMVYLTTDPPLPEMPGEIMQGLARSIRETDITVSFAPSALGLLLIDADIASIPAIVARVVGDLLALAGNSLSWSAGCSTYPKTASGADGVVKQAIDLMVRAREDGGDRLYLPRAVEA